MLSLLMLSATGMLAMAEERGGPNSGGDRPEICVELRISDKPYFAQQRPCALLGLHVRPIPVGASFPLLLFLSRA